MTAGLALLRVSLVFALPAAGLAAPPAADASAGDVARNAARMPDPARLRAFHDLLASEPHVAGTPGDARTIERLAAAFRAMGEGLQDFEVEVQEFFPLLSHPVHARLEILDADSEVALALELAEPSLDADPATSHPDLDVAWNAWSGSGRVEAGVVYVNYGRREDFARLAELGVDPRGKIALARYGGNFRGFKAKFAEAAGCVGLVIFTDPADSGFARGKTWPDGGGWASAASVQRGSILTLGHFGDPLTPGRFASRDAERLDPADVALPRIPVQPIGYGAAGEILARMRGPAAPVEWKGGLPHAYALGDPDLRLRLEVEQRREVLRTANVIARLRGATRPGERVVVGSHHDAWGFGAGDPLAGTICMLESARNFCELARRGVRLDRTLVFCAWGAEEYGIFGSAEYVELLGPTPGTDVYLNLDMAAMGLKPGAGASPALRPALARALASAPGPGGAGTALEVWNRGEGGRPNFGDLGGGSDHLAFWCGAGVPSVVLSAGGVEGVSYHSNYDTLAWYRANVDDEGASARLVTGIANAMVAVLADAASPTMSAEAIAADSVVQATRLREFAASRSLGPEIDAAIAALVFRFEGLRGKAAAADARLAADPGRADAATLGGFQAAFLDEAGLVGRPSNRNLAAAADRYTGYGASTWPLLREALEDAEPGSAVGLAEVLAAARRYARAAERFEAALQSVLPETVPATSGTP